MAAGHEDVLHCQFVSLACKLPCTAKYPTLQARSEVLLEPALKRIGLIMDITHLWRSYSAARQFATAPREVACY